MPSAFLERGNGGPLAFDGVSDETTDENNGQAECLSLIIIPQIHEIVNKEGKILKKNFKIRQIVAKFTA